MLRRTACKIATSVPTLRSHAAAAAGTRSFVTAKLHDLDYDYGALEPVIIGDIMQASALQDAAALCKEAAPQESGSLYSKTS